jgi:hypothetical protein
VAKIERAWAGLRRANPRARALFDQLIEAVETTDLASNNDRNRYRRLALKFLRVRYQLARLRTIVTQPRQLR